MTVHQSEDFDHSGMLPYTNHHVHLRHRKVPRRIYWCTSPRHCVTEGRIREHEMNILYHQYPHNPIANIVIPSWWSSIWCLHIQPYSIIQPIPYFWFILNPRILRGPDPSVPMHPPKPGLPATYWPKGRQAGDEKPASWGSEIFLSMEIQRDQQVCLWSIDDPLMEIIWWSIYQ